MSLSTMGIVSAQTSGTTGSSPPDTNGNTNQNAQSGTGASCTQDQINAAKQGMADIKQKISALRTQYYNDWQTAHNSGQYNGTWEQYSRDKISSSSDLSQIKSEYQQYSSTLRSCGVGPMQATSYSSTTCTQSDITNARQELTSIMQQGMELRNKVYQQFQQDQSSGKFSGTWNQYAQQNLWNLPEVSQLKSTQEKDYSFLKGCFGHGFNQGYGNPQSQNGMQGAMSPQGQYGNQGGPPPQGQYGNQGGPPPQGQYGNQGSQNSQGQNDNNMPPPPGMDNSGLSSPPNNSSPGSTGNDLSSNNNIPNTSTQTSQSQSSLPFISTPNDALGTISSSQGLPPWVKGIAGWWAEGKISDAEFVQAIQFLVHQGIIKV